MLHSGGVRAFSHLPAQRLVADPAGPLAQRGVQAIGHPFQRMETQDAATPHEDGISAAKASGVFDAVRQQFNRDDSPHFMDEDGNLRPRDEVRQQGAADAPPRTEWGTGRDDDASQPPHPQTHASNDTSPWHRPPVTHEDLRSLGFDEGASGPHSTFAGSPLLDDIVSRPRSGSTPGPLLNELVYRYNGNPEDAKKQNWSLYQNAAGTAQTAQLLAARADAPAKNEEQPQGPGSPPPRASNETPQQQAAAAQAQNAANTTPKQPVQNEENPADDLKEHLKKSGNPFFVKSSYDARTPLADKLRLRQLLLSLKAPPGEKLPFFIAHLQHWLNAKNRGPSEQEKPMEYALEDFKHFPVVPEAFEKVLNHYGTAKDSHLGNRSIFDWLRANPDAAKPEGVDVPDTYFETVAEGGSYGYPKPNNEAFYYGFGGAPLTVRSSGVKGFVHPNGTVTFRGTFTPELDDKYDWNKGQGTPLKLSPRIPMEMIRKFIPKDIPVVSPGSDEISVGDSFFKELQELGYGRDFKIKAPGRPMTIEFYQAKPGGPFLHRMIQPSPNPGQPRFDQPHL
jgi:hypothetical protein